MTHGLQLPADHISVWNAYPASRDNPIRVLLLGPYYLIDKRVYVRDPDHTRGPASSEVWRVAVSVMGLGLTPIEDEVAIPRDLRLACRAVSRLADELEVATMLMRGMEHMIHLPSFVQDGYRTMLPERFPRSGHVHADWSRFAIRGEDKASGARWR